MTSVTACVRACLRACQRVCVFACLRACLRACAIVNVCVAVDVVSSSNGYAWVVWVRADRDVCMGMYVVHEGLLTSLTGLVAHWEEYGEPFDCIMR